MKKLNKVAAEAVVVVVNIHPVKLIKFLFYLLVITFFIQSSSFLYHCLSPQNWCSCGTPPPEAVVHLGPHCSSTLPYHALLRGTFFGKKCPENGILIKCFLFRGTFCPFREKPRGTFCSKSTPNLEITENKCPRWML